MYKSTSLSNTASQVARNINDALLAAAAVLNNIYTVKNSNGKDTLLYNFATPIFFMAGVFTKLHAGAAHLLM